MKEWSGLIFLVGAVAGYAVFMLFQPERRSFGEAYRAVRDYPCLWLVAGVFEAARISLVAVAGLARGEITPDEFLAGEPVKLVPYLKELFAPAAEAAAGSLLRVATFMVEAWPLSVALAVCLLCNVSGAVRHLWVSPDGKRKVGRWAFTVTAIAAGLAHLAETAMRVIPSRWVPELRGGPAEVLAAGSDLFVVGCGVTVQIWVVLWMVQVRRSNFKGVLIPAAVGRAGSLFLVMVIYTAARRVHAEMGDTIYGRVAMLCGAAAAFFLLAAQVQVITAARGFISGVRENGLWLLSNWDRAFWWLAAAGIHLFFLHLCGLGVHSAVGELPWAEWCWGAFFSFLKAGVYVWLLGAFVMLTRESGDGRGNRR